MASVAYQAHEAGFFELFPGEPRRDFVYIEDVASANYHAVTNNISNGAYDVGTSEPRRFEDVCDLMHIKYSYQSKHHIPHGYQTYTCADKKEWMPGWEPTFSLEQGVSCYLNYLGESKT
jgi:nucleoside-diphosphate-sugar epimerase